MSDFVKVTGLWKNKTKEGKEMLAGFIGSAKVIILPNREKSNEKDHDYFLFITPAPPRDRKQEADNHE